VFGAAAALYALGGGALRAVPPLSVGLAAMVIISLVLHGVLNGEELGWRGVALPRLLQRANALTASLILGVVWALFHLPLFFTRGGGVGGNQADESMLAFGLQVLASSILVTWLCNNTRGSLLMAYLLHAAVNTWPDLFHAAGAGGDLAWYQAGLFALAAVIVVVVYGPARLSRQPAAASAPAAAADH
jgi:membrane protease YdiL (CAAX protease family)